MLIKICLILLLQRFGTLVKAGHTQYDCPGSDWTDNGRYCYIFEPNIDDFTDAQTDCNQEGAHLTSIHSGEEDLFILQVAQASASSNDFWIGLSSVTAGLSSSGVWEDGTPRDYSNWKLNEPGVNNQCVTVNNERASKWRGRSCSSEYSYICKYDKECGGDLPIDFTPTTFTSVPGASVEYHNHAHCTWYFQTQFPDTCILLSFSSIDIQCDFDYLQVYGGTQSNSPALTDRLCGTTSPGSVYTTSQSAVLLFVTDGSGTASGFSLTYNFVACSMVSQIDVCSTRNTLPDGTIEFLSHPNFGSSDYNARTECIWPFSVMSGVTVYLDIQSMQLQSHPQCVYDFLEIRLGTNETGELVGRYCELSNPTYLALPGPGVWIHLVTDDTIQGDGFNIRINTSECGGRLSASAGTVQSNNYPNTYPDGEVCAWEITAPFGYHIQISFNSAFTIDCSGSLKIEDGPFSSSTSVGSYCGGTAPANYTSTTNVIVATFLAETANLASPGFQFSYTFVAVTLPCKRSTEAQSATVSFPFDTLSGNAFRDGTYPVSTSKGTPSLVEGIEGNAVYLDGRTVLTLGNRQQNCFFDPELCSTGATLAMWIQYRGSLAGDQDVFEVLSSGGQTDESYGWSIYINPSSSGAGLMVDLSTKTHSATLLDVSWSINSSLIEDHWIHVAISFDNSGIFLYKNGAFVRYTKLTARQNNLVTDRFREFVFGVPNDQQDTDYYSGGGYIDELLFWDSVKDQDFIATLYDNYNSDRVSCSLPYVCVDGSCVCPNDGIDCNATVTMTSDTDTTSPISEPTSVQFTCVTDAAQPFELVLMFDNGTLSEYSRGPVNQSTYSESISMSRHQNSVRFFCRGRLPSDTSSYIDSEASLVYNVEYGPDSILFTTNKQVSASYPEDTVVEFTCTVEANPLPLISIWRTDVGGDDIKLAEQTMASLSFSTQIALRKHFNGEEFYCKVSHSAITVISDDKFTYNVTYPVLTVDISSSLSPDEPVTENRNVIITCTADANPVPMLTISVKDKYGNPLTDMFSPTDKLSMPLTLTREYNEASITCYAEPERVESDTLEYLVLYQPSDVMLTSNIPDGQLLSEGTVVTFNCSVDANPDPVLSLWISDGQTEQKASYQTATHHELIITFTLLKEHSGANFYCKAILSDPEYQLTSNAFSYSIAYEPTGILISSTIATGRTLQENTLVVLTCTTDKHPPGLLSLVQNPGTQMIDSDTANSLTVPLLLTREYHQTLFQCQVTDSNSNILVSPGGFQYHIEYDVFNVTLSSDTVSGSTIQEGHVVTFICDTDQNPVGPLALVELPTGEEIDTALANVLTVQVEMTRHHNGVTFKCKTSEANLRNPVMSAEGFMYNVEYGASEVLINSTLASGVTVQENTQVVLTCFTDTHPMGNLSLVQNPGSHQISTDTVNTLTVHIQLTREYHQALFQCQVADADSVLLISTGGFQYNIEYNAHNVTIDSNAAAGSTIQEGAIVTFTCDTDQNPPGPMSLLKYPNAEIIASETGNLLSVPVLMTREHHMAIFKCQTSDTNNQNSILSVHEYQYNVEYDASEVIITSDTLAEASLREGSEVRLTCSTTRNPPGQLTLFSASQSQVLRSEVATTFTSLQSLTRAKNGLDFMCSASNGDNSDIVSTHSYSYDIEFPPSSIILVASHDDPVDAGLLVTLTCTSDEHNPPHPITWRRDGRVISTDEFSSQRGHNNGQILKSAVLVTADPAFNNSVYECRMGQLSDVYTLYVKEIPEEPSSKTLYIGLGVAGGVLAVGSMVGIAIALTLSSKSTPSLPPYSLNSGKSPNRSYIPRGYRSNPPTNSFYKQRF